MGAVSWYRGFGPWSEIAKSYRDEVQVHFCTMPPSWMEIAQSDCLVMIRPYREEHLNLVKVCGYYGTKVWVDYDDDLFNLTSDNPSKAVFEQPKAKLTIRAILSGSEFVTFSTNRLMDSWKLLGLLKHRGNFTVINNALDCRAFPSVPRISEKENKIKSVIWRGLGSHLMDLEEFREPILRLHSEQPEVKFVFFGAEPWFFEKIEGAIVVRATELPMYFEQLGKIECNVAIVPLRDTKFNRCKSNIAAMELCHTGAVCVVPDWDEWQIPGCQKYKNQQSFYEALKLALDPVPSRHHLNDMTHSRFSKEYASPTLNQMRMRLVEKI